MKLNPKDYPSLFYHDLFDYPLTPNEALSWRLNTNKIRPVTYKKTGFFGGYFFVAGKKANITLRQKREEISLKKLTIARRAASVLAKIPSVKMVAVTGSLAMKNSLLKSDIDLMIVVGRNSLWTTRLLAYLLLKFRGFRLRRFGVSDEKDSLCLNLWLDESGLKWPEERRNLFCAHEILQIIPLVNKEYVYERFLRINKWAKDYWVNKSIPKVKRIKRQKTGVNQVVWKIGVLIFEPVLFLLQRLYMRSKITRETIRADRAFFHPSRKWEETIARKFIQL